MINPSVNRAVEATHFQLYKRAKHVLTEARRVLQFRRACMEAETATASDSSEAALISSLGRLMNDSQASCAELFECSCPELNDLTRLARQAGAYGSRLTGKLNPSGCDGQHLLHFYVVGAGWGGCTVSLVAEGKVEEFIQKVKETYNPYKNLEGAALSEAIFATKPGRGACGKCIPCILDAALAYNFVSFEVRRLIIVFFQVCTTYL